jgi:hypothetical protein
MAQPEYWHQLKRDAQRMWQALVGSDPNASLIASLSMVAFVGAVLLAAVVLQSWLGR